MSTVLKPKYVCPECAGLHDDFDEAVECCTPHIDVVYLCPTCHERYSMESNAIECHGFDPDGPPPPPTAAELEAAGQERLF